MWLLKVSLFTQSKLYCIASNYIVNLMKKRILNTDCKGEKNYQTRWLAKSLHWCSTLRNPMDCSRSDSSVHGILQARILEWTAMPFSRGSFQPRAATLQLFDDPSVSYITNTIM